MTTYEQTDIRREALYVLTNAITATNDSKVIEYLFMSNEGKIMEIFVKNLKSLNDVTIVIEIIQALDLILGLEPNYEIVEEETPPYKFEILGGIDILEEL